MYFTPSGRDNFKLLGWLLVVFLCITEAKSFVKSYKQRTQIEVTEAKKIEYYESFPASYYFEYKALTVESVEVKSKKQGNEEITYHAFKVISDKRHDKKKLTSLWRDTALFYDENGLPYARTIDCYPQYQVRRDDCDEDGYYQHQWWLAEVPVLERDDTQAFIYKQYNIPVGAVYMELCMFQTITVHKSEILNKSVIKQQSLCTQRYKLKDLLAAGVNNKKE